MFRIEFWNMYERVLNGESRTTNNVEEWHRALQSLLCLTHPTLWKLIDGLKRHQKLKDTEIEQLVAGRDPVTRKQKYIQLDERIRNVVEDYDNRDYLNYLRGIAHNLYY